MSASPSGWGPRTCSSSSTPPGTTAKPKGDHAHHRPLPDPRGVDPPGCLFDLHPDRDVYWCVAHIGWVTGHSYIVYGPLANGATLGDVRGDAGLPRPGPVVVDRGAVRRHHPLRRAPTAIRSFIRQATGFRPPRPHHASGSWVRWGSPSTPRPGCGTHPASAGGRCPVVDTWWQTETGAILISPVPGAHHHQARVGHVPPSGDRGGGGRRGGGPGRARGGYLTLMHPWPGMTRGIYGDPERFRETYWSWFPGRLLRRGRGQGRRRRLPVAPRPGRRRHERLGPPDLHHRGGVVAGRPSRGGRGRRGGRHPRHHRAVHRGLRHPAHGVGRARATSLGSELRVHVAGKIGAHRPARPR